MIKLYQIIFLSILCFSCENVMNAQCHPDIDALLSLYESTDGENWVNNSGWKDGAEGNDCEPCSWYGVTCQFNRVINILMIQNNMSGEIPDNISELSQLGSLILTSNDIRGELPNAFYDLDLTNFNCSNCNLSGSISSRISDLENLRSLLLNGNDLTGEIPSQLGSLSELSMLALAGNCLSGEIPDEMGGLTSITLLIASENNLTGKIPRSLGDLNNLETVNFSFNFLSGELPHELSNLDHAEGIFFQENNLQGCFPDSYTSLCNVVVDFSFNNNLPNDGDFDLFCQSGDGACITSSIDLEKEAMEKISVFNNGNGSIVLNSSEIETIDLYTINGERINNLQFSTQSGQTLLEIPKAYNGILILVFMIENQFHSQMIFV